MSFNIISVKVKEIDCWLTGRELRDIFRECEHDLPETNLFDSLDLLKPTDDERVAVSDLSWSGTWSGNSYKTFRTVLGRLHGSAKFSVTWEDGDIEYFRLLDGGILKQLEIDY
jgi:hypothetical protein